jgi:hypothetical protein
MPQVTNPAAEIYALCKKLDRIAAKEPSRDVLSKHFGVTPDETDFYAIVTALSARFDSLGELVNILPQYATPQKSVAINAITHLRGFLRPHALNKIWDEVKSSAFKPDYLVPLHMIDPLIQHIAPISLPTEEERQKILESLDAAIAELFIGNCVAATSLAISLKATRKIVEKLEFFGIDELLERIANSDAYLRAATRASDVRTQSNMMSALRKAGIALSLVLNALVVADTGITAVENDYQRGQALIEFINNEIEIAPLQLPAPKVAEDQLSGIVPESTRQQPDEH